MNRSMEHDTSNLFRWNVSVVLKDLDGLDGCCDDDSNFMEMTQENLDEAEPEKFYHDFMVFLSGKHIEQYKKKRGPRLFKKIWLADPNFDCSMHFPGCVPVPSYRDIVQSIRKITAVTCLMHLGSIIFTNIWRSDRCSVKCRANDKDVQDS